MRSLLDKFEQIDEGRVAINKKLWSVKEQQLLRVTKTESCGESWRRYPESTLDREREREGINLMEKKTCFTRKMVYYNHIIYE